MRDSPLANVAPFVASPSWWPPNPIMNEQLVHAAFGKAATFVSESDDIVSTRLLTYLKSWDLRSFHPRNVVSSVKQFYPAQDSDQIAEAVYTAWNTLVRRGLLVPDHQSVVGDWYVISSRGKATTNVQEPRTGDRGDIRVNLPRNAPEPNTRKNEYSSTVMVVYGRDTILKESMFAFLRSLNLNPLEWEVGVRNTGIATPYVGQVIDAIFNSAQAIVVILSGDDEARLREDLCRESDGAYEKELTYQARPNVIFEAGLAFGLKPDNTILVEVGKLRPFSDIGGRHVIRFDGTEQKRADLANRLITAGCKVDLSNDAYLSLDLSYDFSGARESPSGRAVPLSRANTKATLKLLERELADNAAKLRLKTKLGGTRGPVYSPSEYDPGVEFLSSARWESFQRSDALGTLNPDTTALLADAYGYVEILKDLESDFRKVKSGPAVHVNRARYDLRNTAGPALTAIERALLELKSQLDDLE